MRSSREAEGAIAPVAVDQGLGAAAEVNRLDRADDNPMAVAPDDFLDHAINDGESVLQARGAGGELTPSGAFIARAARDAAAPGESIRNLLMARVENADAIVALALDDRPGRALRLTQTSMVGASTESEMAVVTVSPVLASPRRR